MSDESVEEFRGTDFKQEIKKMMYTFGDSGLPNPETVVLIEKVTHTQITETFKKAVEVMKLKGKRTVSVEDILFLLRKYKAKLRAILRHLEMKEMAKKAKPAETDELDVPLAKKRKWSLDFLASSEQVEVENLKDSAYLEALHYMDEITQDMTESEYVQYSQCRQANFHKNTTKFKAWLESDLEAGSKLTQEVTEVLGFLAYETVKEIVELSLQVREDARQVSLNTTIISSHSNPLPFTPDQLETTPTFVTVPADGNTELSLPSPSLPQSPPPGSTLERMQKSRKKHGGCSQREAIQPRHVREALRRHGFEMGPMSLLATHSLKSTFYKCTLCT